MARRLIDLTEPFFNGMLYNWYIPGVPRPELTTIRETDEDKKRLGHQKFVTSTHIGTHVDAQRHVLKRGVPIDQYPLERLYGPGLCWDVSAAGRFGEITPEFLNKCQPRMQRGDAVLLHTGYGKYFETNYHLYYEQPYLTIEAARWFIDQGVNIVGIDAHTVDKPWALRSVAHVPNIDKEKQSISPGGSGQPSVHELLQRANILIIEYMADLDKVLGRRFTFCAAPLKLRDGDGAPARCFAIVDE